MTKVILTGPCVGKTYADTHCKGVYDFDKHTLDYKWLRDGFEDLTDEEFKGVSGRKMKDNWEPEFISDMLSLVIEGSYSVVTGPINDNLIRALDETGICFEIVLADPNDPETLRVIRERSLSRGNSLEWLSRIEHYMRSLFSTYKDNDHLRVIVLRGKISLLEYLKETERL